jgi:hypothetical protein
MAFEGMDPSTVQTLVTALNSAHSEVVSSMGNVSSAVNSANWLGPDRSYFDGEWTSAQAQLNAVAERLQELSTYATQKIQAQESASA